jgi:hypothetical protein
LEKDAVLRKLVLVYIHKYLGVEQGFVLHDNDKVLLTVQNSCDATVLWRVEVDLYLLATVGMAAVKICPHAKSCPSPMQLQTPAK